jgi:hypothetical protein
MCRRSVKPGSETADTMFVTPISGSAPTARLRQAAVVRSALPSQLGGALGEGGGPAPRPGYHLPVVTHECE